VTHPGPNRAIRDYNAESFNLFADSLKTAAEAQT
jgi:hypothetical protein